MRFGSSPRLVPLTVVTGQDFVEYLNVDPSDPFPDPAHTLVSLHIFDSNKRDATQIGWWPAVLVEEGGAQVQIDAEEMDSIPSGCWYRVIVTETPGPRSAWFRGPVRREN